MIHRNLQEFYYGRSLPTDLPADTINLIVESSELLDRLVASKSGKAEIVLEKITLEKYLDNIADKANASNDVIERRFLANALETWRYFLANQGISIRNHLIYSKEEIFDRRSSAENTASWARLNRHSHSNGLGVIHGKATRDTLDKTVSVEVVKIVQHKSTKKHIKKTKKYLVHDEFNKVSTGDTVIATETRPLSKRKRFELFAILRKNR